MTLKRCFLAATLTLLLAATSSAQPHERREGPRGPQDLDGDGVISRAEFDTFSAEQFTRMDTNGDGVISEDEKPQHPMHPGRRGDRGDRGEHRQMMAAGLLSHLADANDDGTVDAVEWQGFLAQLPRGEDGNVDAASFAESLPAPPEGARRRHHERRGDEAPEGARSQRPPRDRGRMVGHLLDTDGDQNLEIADFEALFTTLDANQDGSLSGDEVPRFRHRGPHGG